MACRLTSGGKGVVLAQICGMKYDSSDDIELDGQGMKGDDSMPT